MFGFGRKPEDWFESARKRSQKLERDNMKLLEAQIKSIRSGRGQSTITEAEIQGMRQKAFREMLVDLEKALGQRPDFAEAWFNKGCIHHIMGEWDKALACYDKVLQTNPTHPGALFCVASIKRESGELQEALVYYRKTVQYSPGDADAWYEMAMTLRQIGDGDAAKQAEERAQALEPSLKPGQYGVVVYVPRPRLFP
ncbi:MAG: tetratricopeptide repeat protein [Bacillota bacterium]